MTEPLCHPPGPVLALSLGRVPSVVTLLPSPRLQCPGWFPGLRRANVLALSISSVLLTDVGAALGFLRVSSREFEPLAVPEPRRNLSVRDFAGLVPSIPCPSFSLRLRLPVCGDLPDLPGLGLAPALLSVSVPNVHLSELLALSGFALLVFLLQRVTPPAHGQNCVC